MLTNLVLLACLVIVLIIIGCAYFAFRREDVARANLAESIAAGMHLPPSLHPVISLDDCIGSMACVNACPETVLDRIDGVTQMVQAGNCIGHGRCHAGCPVGAIALVFGTAERGVDIPLLRAGYETNVDGVFIVGELGGMGLIRNAMRQGMRAVESIPNVLRREGVAAPNEEIPDVVIIGGGPAGIATAVRCVEDGIGYTLLEQFTLGGSVTNYPRRKMVFTEVIKLPLVGKFGKAEMLKEELVAEFERVLLSAGITMLEGRRAVAVDGSVGDFRVTCQLKDGKREVYRGRTVVLAIGRRGTPRTLGIRGEALPHVVYKMIEPEQYRHRRILCVGGGDSAVEAAVALSLVAGTTVHLSYRGKSFYRVKKKARTDLDRVVEEGRVTLHMETNVLEITSGSVQLEGKEGRFSLEIDDVIVNIGGELPATFLGNIGVEVETKRGEIAKAPTVGRRSGRHSGRISGRKSGRQTKKSMRFWTQSWSRRSKSQ